MDNSIPDNSNANPSIPVESSNLETQLSQIGSQLSEVMATLKKLQPLSDKVDRIEKQLLAASDVYLYQKLQAYLEAQDWDNADRETIALIVEIAGVPELNALRPEKIRGFPCSQLQAIDRLWTTYSGDRFGFSPQLQAFQDLGGTLESTIAQDRTVIEQWGERLGWRANDSWLRCDELDYSLQAPVGGFPARLWNSPYGWKMTYFFLSRLLICELS
ncbi:MAG: GUN4 domain-containing protein [Synechococcus sp.]